MMNVVLDTNALFFPFQFKVNIEERIRELLGECTIYIPDVVLQELDNLQKKGNRDAAAAVRYAQRFSQYTSKSNTRGDTGVLAAAEELHAILVTSDRELISRAKSSGLKVIFLRGKQKLELK